MTEGNGSRAKSLRFLETNQAVENSFSMKSKKILIKCVKRKPVFFFLLHSKSHWFVSSFRVIRVFRGQKGFVKIRWIEPASPIFFENYFYASLQRWLKTFRVYSWLKKICVYNPTNQHCCTYQYKELDTFLLTR